MNIKIVVVGDLKTNCYIIEKGNTCLIIDPGADFNLIDAAVDKTKIIAGVIVTHSHEDHTGAIGDCLAHYQCKLYSKNNFQDGMNTIENFNFECIYTPGHMDDSICIYFKEEKVMFAGDFIFKGGIGRTDMVWASPFDMKQSIKRIIEYPDDITVFPGHFASTTLGEEKPNLIYFMNTL